MGSVDGQLLQGVHEARGGWTGGLRAGISGRGLVLGFLVGWFALIWGVREEERQ